MNTGTGRTSEKSFCMSSEHSGAAPCTGSEDPLHETLRGYVAAGPVYSRPEAEVPFLGHRVLPPEVREARRRLLLMGGLLLALLLAPALLRWTVGL